MPKLSLTEQIAKAAMEGDLEKVRMLGEKLKEQTAKTKPKPKPKAKPKNRPQVEDVPILRPDDLPDYLSVAKTGNKRTTYVNEDGEEKEISKKVPFKAVKRKNSFQDDLTESVADIEFDKSWQKKAASKSSMKRDKAKKVKVECSRCHELKLVWQNDVLHSHWVCDECLARYGRRG